MALGNLSKKDWKAIRQLQTQAKAELEEINDLSATFDAKTKAALDQRLKLLTAKYLDALKQVQSLVGMFVKFHEEQNDLYQEKLEESERWADSDRAGQVDSWVNALETLTLPEEFPTGLVIDTKEVQYEVKKKDAEGEYVEMESGKFPTKFPTKIDLSYAIDMYALSSYLDEVEALDEDGASVF